ncbi:MAG TPA: MFS transporter [Candidatus Paceibacterota bacterium]
MDELFGRLFAFDHLRDVPAGIKRVTLSRTIRWFGWGLGESLIPIFLLTFSTSFTEAGMLKSIYDAIFLIALPIVSMFADMLTSRMLLIIALIVYPFIGLSYFVAGLTGMVFFIIFARGLNGVAWCVDTIGVDTYVRRTAGPHSAAAAFGYVESIANLGWLAAAVIGFFMVQYVPVHILLFMIVPTSLLALWPLWHLKDGNPHSTRAAHVFHSYQAFFSNVRTWHAGQRRVAWISFFLSVLSSMSTFFLPIAAYERGASLQEVVLMTILFSIPALGAWSIANVVDQIHKRPLLIALLSIMPLMFLGVALVPTYAVEVVAAFAIQVVVVSVDLIMQSYITVISPREQYGSVTGAMDGIKEFGIMVTPVIAGAFADMSGLQGMFGAMFFVSIITALYAYRYPISHRKPEEMVMPVAIPLDAELE